MFALASIIVAMLLAGPVRSWLAYAGWLLRAPRAGVVLCQAVTLAAVLAAFGAGIAVASGLFVPGPDGRPTRTIGDGIDRLGWPLWILSVAVLVLTLVVGVRLLVAMLRVAVGTRRRRAHHRMLVDLLRTSEDPMPSHVGRRAEELRILQIAQPMAYCLPGVRSRVVLSAGMLASLTDTELAAVLSHERAHLRARHDLVLETFTALHTAFPRITRSASTLGTVQLLVELLADDAAVRTTGPAPLARALVACASACAPAGAMAVGGPSTLLRVRRLSGPGNSRALAVAVYLAAAAVLVVPTVALAVPWLIELHRLLAG